MRPLRPRIHAPSRNLGTYLPPHFLELDRALLLPHLQFSLLQNLEEHFLNIRRPERLEQVVRRCDGAFGDVGEDVVDLDDL
jgi:hypothetical protein